MSPPRKPRSRFYDGVVYGALIDPALAELHSIVIEQLNGARMVLDACCGTGAMALRLAAPGREVLGVDLSPRNIALAERRREKTGTQEVRFEVGDVAHLSAPDSSFDVATIVMALHEMPARFRPDVLRELVRVAQRVVVVDYNIPMPKNVAGLRNRAIEFTAGWEHFAAFRDFSRRGGLSRLMDGAPFEARHLRTLDGGTLAIWELATAD